MNINRPMFDMLLKQQNRCSFHMPGHQGYSPWNEENKFYTFDTTELGGTDDLYKPSSGILKAEALMAPLAKADGSIMLTGGSTAGILAMFLYGTEPGEKVIIPRNAHHSVINACVLAGCQPVYVYPQVTEDGYYYYREDDYLSVMINNPDAKAVFITRPDYYGHLLEIEKIVTSARQNNQLVLVDEAHGAHFNWMPEIKGAGELGADIWVQSAHKTLPVLTGGAWLHHSQRVDGKALRQVLQMIQTSSPSFVIMESLDSGRAWMDAYGQKALENLQKKIQAFFKNLLDTAYSNAFVHWEKTGLSFDPLRMVITAPQGGFTLLRDLYTMNVDVEMADARRIICIPSVMTPAESFDKLLSALHQIKPIQKESFQISLPVTSERQQVLPLREAALGKKEWISISKSLGKISAGSVGAYPPGIPWLLPGEKITEEIVEKLLVLPEEYSFGIISKAISCVSE